MSKKDKEQELLIFSQLVCVSDKGVAIANEKNIKLLELCEFLAENIPAFDIKALRADFLKAANTGINEAFDSVEAKLRGGDEGDE